MENRCRAVSLDKPLSLGPEEFLPLAEAVGNWIRPNERPYGICQDCRQNHISAALLEWSYLSGSSSLHIAYGGRLSTCDGNGPMDHYVSSYIEERTDAAVWSLLRERGVQESDMTADPI